jgi:membrane-associated protease RseP (regulator of RpoE activity)
MLLASLSLVLLTGCSGFWTAQGDASRSNAEARRIAAQAQRDNAQAAIIDAQARGTLAESQAQALTTSVDAVVQLATVDDKYATIFAGLLFLVLGAVFAVVVILVYRGFRPHAPEDRPKPKGILIDTPHGPIAMIQEPNESQADFFMRVRDVRALTGKDVISGYIDERR